MRQTYLLKATNLSSIGTFPVLRIMQSVGEPQDPGIYRLAYREPSWLSVSFPPDVPQKPKL